MISTKSASTLPIITEESADQAIQDIRAIGFVDTDGSKLKAIAVHYNTDLQDADIDSSTYTIHDYGMTLSKNDLTQGTNPGIITKVYLNGKPEIASRSKSHDSYVIIEINKDYPFDGIVYYNAPADGNIIWKTDSDGHPANYNNWFYMISDDNILYLNTANENIEYRLLYNELQGVTIPTAELVLDENTTPEKRNKVISELTRMPNKARIYEAVLSGNVSHMSAWFYGHGTPTCYTWLLSQTRKTEMARPKLPLDRPFVLTDAQIHTEDRIFSQDRQNPEKVSYYPTGKHGAGTEGYNSGLTALGSDETLAPEWKPQP